MAETAQKIYGWLDGLLDLHNVRHIKYPVGTPEQCYQISLRLSRQDYWSPHKRFTEPTEWCEDVEPLPHITHLIMHAPDMAWHWDVLHEHFPDLTVLFMDRFHPALVSSKLKYVAKWRWMLNNACDLLDKRWFLYRNLWPKAFDAAMDLQQPDRLRVAGMTWIKSNQDRFFAENPKYRVLRCSYQSLVTEPRETLEELLPLLGLPFDESVTRHFSAYAIQAWNRSPIHARSIDKWKQHITDVQAKEILELIQE